VAVNPQTTLAGLKDIVITAGGATVSPLDVVVPLGSVAVRLTEVLAETGSELALKVPLVAPPAMLKLAGTVAALVLLLARATLKPAVGAGPLRATVPTEPLPPVTELGLNVNDLMRAGLTFKEALILLAPRVAVTLTLFAAATPTVVAVKVCDNFPLRIVTLAATSTEGSELLRETEVPPEGAALLIVTVPVDFVPPVTVAGLKVNLERTGLVLALGVSPRDWPCVTAAPESNSIARTRAQGTAWATALRLRPDEARTIPLRNMLCPPCPVPVRPDGWGSPRVEAHPEQPSGKRRINAGPWLMLARFGDGRLEDSLPDAKRLAGVSDLWQAAKSGSMERVDRACGIRPWAGDW